MNMKCTVVETNTSCVRHAFSDVAKRAAGLFRDFTIAVRAVSAPFASQSFQECQFMREPAHPRGLRMKASRSASTTQYPAGRRTFRRSLRGDGLRIRSFVKHQSELKAGSARGHRASVRPRTLKKREPRWELALPQRIRRKVYANVTLCASVHPTDARRSAT